MASGSSIISFFSSEALHSGFSSGTVIRKRRKSPFPKIAASSVINKPTWFSINGTSLQRNDTIRFNVTKPKTNKK